MVAPPPRPRQPPLSRPTSWRGLVDRYLRAHRWRIKLTVVTEFGGDLKLSEMIEALRVELAAAADAGKDHPLRFEVGPIELEVEIAVTKSTAGNASVEFWVVKAGAERERSDAVTHRIKVTLKPERADGSGPPKVSRTASGPPAPTRS